MADYVNVAEAFKSGYEATGKVREDIESKDIMKQAYEGTPAERDEASGTTTRDMFKVNSLAAQMAAKRGDNILAERFQNKAQQYKVDSYTNQINEMKIKKDKIADVMSQVDMLNSPKDAQDLMMKSDMPTDMKMRLYDALAQAAKDPTGKAFKELQTKFRNSLMTAHEKADIEIRQANLKRQDAQQAEQHRHNVEMERNSARRMDMLENKPMYDMLRDASKDYKKELREIDKNQFLKPEERKARKAEAESRYKQAQQSIRKEFEGDDDEDLGGGGRSTGGKEAQDPSQKELDYLYSGKATPAELKEFDRIYGAGAANEFMQRHKDSSGGKSSAASTSGKGGVDVEGLRSYAKEAESRRLQANKDPEIIKLTEERKKAMKAGNAYKANNIQAEIDKIKKEKYNL